MVTNNWLRSQMPELSNIEYAPEDVPAIGAGMGFAAQACADGMYKIGVYVYTANNLEGRYRQGGDFDDPRVSGNRQWGQPWGDYQGLMTSTNVPVQQYCAKYGVSWDELLSPFVLNQHRNGLLKNPDDYEGWSYYNQYGPSLLTTEDYVNARHIYHPLKIWDCDRPVNSVGAFVFATAERAKDMRQKPVYVGQPTAREAEEGLGAARRPWMTPRKPRSGWLAWYTRGQDGRLATWTYSTHTTGFPPSFRPPWKPFSGMM